MSGAASLNPRGKKGRIVLVAAALLLLACLTAAAGAWKAGRSVEPPGASSAGAPMPAAAAPLTPPSDGLQVVRVTIRPTGFDPVELTLPRGRFLLAVDNRSGLEELTFRLGREAGGRLHEVRMPRGRLAWRSAVDPAPGLYLLTEAGHPGWVCRVRVAD